MFQCNFPQKCFFVVSKLMVTCLINVAVTDIDTSGIHAFEELLRSLQKRDVQVKYKLHQNHSKTTYIYMFFDKNYVTKLELFVVLHNPQLVLANPGPVVIDKLHTSNFANLIGEDKIYLTVAEAVAFCSPKITTDP